MAKVTFPIPVIHSSSTHNHNQTKKQTSRPMRIADCILEPLGTSRMPASLGRAPQIKHGNNAVDVRNFA